MARGRSGRRTDYTWLGNADTVQAIDNAELVKSNPFGFTFTTAQTITRTRGVLRIILDPSAADEKIVVACGMIVVSAAAFAAGLASLPGPHSESGDDWFWHSYLAIGGADVVTNTGGVAQNPQVVIDSKAMRKVKQGEVAVLVTQVAAAVDQGGSHDVMAGVRLLIGT